MSESDADFLNRVEWRQPSGAPLAFDDRERLLSLARRGAEMHRDSRAMTAEITIPPAALEAAAKAMWKTDDPSQWEIGMARAALLAGLKAWPGLSRVHRDWDGTALVCLPLPQENSNAEG